MHTFYCSVQIRLREEIQMVQTASQWLMACLTHGVWLCTGPTSTSLIETLRWLNAWIKPQDPAELCWGTMFLDSEFLKCTTEKVCKTYSTPSFLLWLWLVVVLWGLNCSTAITHLKEQDFSKISVNIHMHNLFLIFFLSLASAGSSNGCSNNVGACEQLCLPRLGGLFSCACATGFRLNGDNRTCAPYQSYVVISMLTAIKGFSLEGEDHSEAMVPVAGRGWRFTY